MSPIIGAMLGGAALGFIFSYSIFRHPTTGEMLLSAVMGAVVFGVGFALFG